MSSSPLILEQTPAGNDLDIQRDVPGITVTDPLVKAWLTIKVRILDADGAGTGLQKLVTPILGANGHIAQDGSLTGGNGTGSMFFQITKAETLALGWVIRYYWDITCLTASGRLYTAAHPDNGRTVGRLQFTRRVATVQA